MITTPTSTYSFNSDEKRPVPPSPCLSTSSTLTAKPRSDSQSSAESNLTCSTAATSPSPTPLRSLNVRKYEHDPQDGKDTREQKEEYLSQAEITSITTRVTKFVGSLTNYGQLIEKSHLALQADLNAILNLIPLPIPTLESVPKEKVGEGKERKEEVEVVKISLLSSHRSTRLTKLPSLHNLHPTFPSSPTSTGFKETPPYEPPNYLIQARTQLTLLQSSLSQAYAIQKESFANKYWPLITLLPRNWIMFSRMGRAEQEVDVQRHLRRLKGEWRARDGLLLGLIRGLSCLAKESGEEGLESGMGWGGNGERAFENLEEFMGREWEGILVVLKGVERERRAGKGLREDASGEGKDWSSPAMKWRVFGLVLKERVRLLSERRGDILRERVKLSAVLLGVFEDVREGCEVLQ